MRSLILVLDRGPPNRELVLQYFPAILGLSFCLRYWYGTYRTLWLFPFMRPSSPSDSLTGCLVNASILGKMAWRGMMMLTGDRILGWCMGHGIRYGFGVAPC